MDKEARKNMYWEAEDIIMFDEAWWIVLYQRTGFHAMQDYVKGFVWDIRSPTFEFNKHIWLDK